MKLLIDANVVLDVLEARAGFYSSSLMIWKLCEAGHCEGCVSSLSVADLVYIMRKELDPERTDGIIRRLGQIFTFADLTGTDLLGAASLRWPDFEDALQYTAAQRIGADCIITRNTKDFTSCGIPPYTPDEFLDRFY